MEVHSPAVAEQTQLPLGEEPVVAPARIDGLRYEPDYITAENECELLEWVDQQQWSTQLARRVQHFGWKYDYKARRVTQDAYIGPLPDTLRVIAERIACHVGMAVADQVIVNEYEPGQGIAKHTDCQPCFGPTVTMVSLNSDIEMDFTGPEDQRVPIQVERRSLLVLDGEARHRWGHEIPKRRSDPKFGIQRRRRVSLTFRTVIVD